MNRVFGAELEQWLNHDAGGLAMPQAEEAQLRHLYRCEIRLARA